jgi:hypothetical protein
MHRKDYSEEGGLTTMTSQMIPGTGKDYVIDGHIKQASGAADYKGFGFSGCDLSKNSFWAAYQRQSQEEQVNNNRLPDLFTHLLTEPQYDKG